MLYGIAPEAILIIIARTVLAAVLVLGILLSVVATFFAVNKYLRMGVDKLYYI